MPGSHDTPKSISVRNAAVRVVAAVEAGTPISVFVGAAVSKASPSNLPEWKEFRDVLLTAMIDRLREKEFISARERNSIHLDLMTFGSKHRLWFAPEVVLQWVFRFTPGAIKNIFSVFSLGLPNLNHRVLAHLSLLPDVRIATSNFDLQIERALAETGHRHQTFAGPRNIGTSCNAFHEYARLGNSSRHSAVPILKIHGCASEFSTIRATIEQVSRPMGKGAREALGQLIRQRFLIVAGYGGRDFDIFPQIESLIAESQGVLWLARTPESISPELRRLPNTTIAIGNLCTFFRRIADQLGLSFENERHVPLDLPRFAQEAFAHTRPVPIALGVSSLAMHVGCFDVVRQLSEKVIKSSPSKPSDAVFALLTLGDTKRRSDPEGALACFENAERLVRKFRSEMPALYARTLGYIAGQYILYNNLSKALSLNTRCISWAKRGNDSRGLPLYLDDRALIFRRCGNVKHAIRLRREALRKLEKSGDLINLSMVLNNLGADHDVLEQLEEAEKWWRKSLELKEKYTSNSPDLARTYFNLGELLRRAAKIGEAFEQLARARSRARLLQDRVVEARAVYALAAIASQIEKPDQARRLMEVASRIASKTPDWKKDADRLKWERQMRWAIMRGATKS